MHVVFPYLSTSSDRIARHCVPILTAHSTHDLSINIFHELSLKQTVETDLIKDQKCTILVTDRFHSLEISFGCGNTTGGSAHYSFCNNCSLSQNERNPKKLQSSLTSDDSVWSKLQKFIFQLFPQPFNVLLLRFLEFLKPSGIGWRDMMEMLTIQNCRIRLTPCRIPPQR